MKLSDIAARIGAEVTGDGALEVTGLAPLESAGPDDLCLYLGGKYRRHLASTGARALLTDQKTPAEGFSLLRVARPRLAFIEVLRIFHPEARRAPGVHPTAVVGEGAVLGEGVFLGARAVVGERTRLGDGTEVHAGAVLYEDVVAGRGCRVYAGAVIREGTVMGDRVIVHPGAVIGADGFGYERGDGGVLHKIPQVGRVVLEDDVEIGANTCVDRAALGETRIGAGTRIDNLCQVGHNTRIGRNTAISGSSGVSGSVVIGDRVTLGGNVGVADHVTIGDDVMVAGRAGIIGDVPPRSIVAGFPDTDLRTWRKAMAILYRQAKKARHGGDEG